jgi:hypothetical protein
MIIAATTNVTFQVGVCAFAMHLRYLARFPRTSRL